MVATAPEVGIAQRLLDELDLQEVVDVEEASGVSMGAFQHGGVVSFRFVVALAWVVKRRTDPEFTYTDAGKLKMRDLESLLAPTPAAPLEPLKKPAARRGSS
jgi:hypothetical protein